MTTNVFPGPVRVHYGQIELEADEPDEPSARSRPPGPVPVRVSTHGAGVESVTAIAALDVAFCLVQPLPDGHILVVGARRRAGGANAVVFDAAGQRVREVSIGDGIEHVLTTTSGQVWVGYFDEGVYGGDPVAHHGIVRFDEKLLPAWTYPFDTGFGPVDDCYALNVDGETAWSCYYGDFPIVRIVSGAASGWHNQITGATALMVEANTCILVGGYRSDYDRLVIGYLDTDRYEPVGQQRIALPDGRPIPRDATVVGRGPDLHVFAGTAWYRLGIDDLT
jgi:hypothetical protein